MIYSSGATKTALGRAKPSSAPSASAPPSPHSLSTAARSSCSKRRFLRPAIWTDGTPTPASSSGLCKSRDQVHSGLCPSSTTHLLLYLPSLPMANDDFVSSDMASPSASKTRTKSAATTRQSAGSATSAGPHPTTNSPSSNTAPWEP